jgi:rhodanese-related sulfurtransferase
MKLMSGTNISPGELFQLQNQGDKIDLIDVRTAAEYNSGHIPGAMLLSLDDINDHNLEHQLGAPQKRGDLPVYITCQSGFRAQQAADQFLQHGYSQLVLIEGGTEAWEKAGLPMKRCSKVISLERQVQIAIGTLLLLKVFFGFTLHELFFLAGALIGAGLILAGVTRWCGLARLLAMMPWNRNQNCNGKVLA